MFVPLIELVSDKGGYARFDSTRAERDQPEPDIKTGAVRDKHRQARLAHAIHQTQPQDGVAFAKKTVSQPTAQQREKVNANDERVENVLRAPGAFCLRQVKKQRRDEEDGQNVPHPVKTEALASLVADDVADLFRDRRLWIQRNACRKQNFRLGDFLHDRERGHNAANAQLHSGLAIFGVLKLHRYSARFRNLCENNCVVVTFSWRCRLYSPRRSMSLTGVRRSGWLRCKIRR